MKNHLAKMIQNYELGIYNVFLLYITISAYINKNLKNNLK